jgi:hypothetical protein
MAVHDLARSDVTNLNTGFGAICGLGLGGDELPEDVPFLRNPFLCWILAVRDVTLLEVHGVPGVYATVLWVTRHSIILRRRSRARTTVSRRATGRG